MLEATVRPPREWRTIGWTGEPTGPPALRGGRLCLDFANTIGFRGTEHPIEFLTSYAVLVAWASYTGSLREKEAARLRQIAERRPEEAAAVHRQAIAFRDTIYRLFAAIGRREAPAPADLDEVSRIYQRALDHARLRPRAERFDWEWLDDGDDLTRPLWPVARSAVELLTTDDLDRIKVCRGGDDNSCWWVFFDATKNRIRRWCSMENCGSSAKARRQTARRRARRAGRAAS